MAYICICDKADDRRCDVQVSCGWLYFHDAAQVKYGTRELVHLMTWCHGIQRNHAMSECHPACRWRVALVIVLPRTKATEWVPCDKKIS